MRQPPQEKAAEMLLEYTHILIVTNDVRDRRDILKSAKRIVKSSIKDVTTELKQFDGTDDLVSYYEDVLREIEKL